MLKSNEKTLAIVHRFIDIFLSIFVWCLLQVTVAHIYDLQTVVSIHLKISFPLGFLTFYFLARTGLYRSQRLSTLRTELVAVVRANFFAVLAFYGLIFFVSEMPIPEYLFLIYFLISSLVFMSYRTALRVFLRSLRRAGKNNRHVVLVGYGKILESYVSTIQGYPDAGINWLTWIDSRGAAPKFGIKVYQGSLADYLKEHNVDSIVIGYPYDESQLLETILKENYDQVASIMVLPDLRYNYIGFQADNMAGFPTLLVNQPTLSTIDEVSKRTFDIIASGIGILLLSPLLILLGLLVKISSKGTIFFSQERVGLDGRYFRMWKFRTMIQNAEEQSRWTIENDPRRTKIGSLMRATSLDELPQLWNVFVGDMSLVGPRPEQPQFVTKFRHEIPAYMLRHKMKAGITGWAQVNGWRGNTSLEKRIECDLYYVKNWSLWFDIKIILMTFWRGFANRNAY